MFIGSTKISSKIAEITNDTEFQTGSSLFQYPKYKTISHPKLGLFDGVPNNQQYLWVSWIISLQFETVTTPKD